MTVSLNHVNAISLFVEDLAAAKAFYTGVFGVPLIYEDGFLDAPPRFAQRIAAVREVPGDAAARYPL